MVSLLSFYSESRSLRTNLRRLGRLQEFFDTQIYPTFHLNFSFIPAWNSLRWNGPFQAE